VVVDTGSAMLRAGFASEGLPRVVACMDGGHRVGGCTALTGSPRSSTSSNGHHVSLLADSSSTAPVGPGRGSHTTALAGCDAFEVDWEQLTQTWETLFSGPYLDIDPMDHAFVMSTLPDMRPSSRAAAMELLFETFGGFRWQLFTGWA
jgi:hypothetical protein